MTHKTKYFSVIIILAAGCTAGPRPFASLADSSTSSGAADSATAVTQVDFEEPATPELVQPQTVAGAAKDTAESMSPQPLPPTSGLTAEALEQMALSNSPAIAQASARVWGHVSE